MAFHDVQLPDDVEQGAQGGLGFKTNILELASGHEKRNMEWAQARGEWDIGYGIQSKALLTRVRNFKLARRGAAHSFRFKDWSDYEFQDDGTDDPMVFAIGDASTLAFQFTKTYEDEAGSYVRDITRPVDGTITIYFDGVLQSALGYTINYDTGVITFSVAPGNLVEVGVLGEFDVPVRFKDDRISINMRIFNAGSIPNIPVIEVRPEE